MGEIVVFGAGGRAGRAVTEEALRRGHTVTGAVRDPAKHTAAPAAGAPGARPAAGAPAPGAQLAAGPPGSDARPAAGAPGSGEPGVRFVAADVTDAAQVAAVSAGHDAAVHAAANLAVPPGEFFTGAANALVSGLEQAGVGRLVTIGLASALATADGTPLMDTPGYPQEYRAFYLGHAAGADALQTAATTVDWLVLSPSGDFHDGDVHGSDFHDGNFHDRDFHGRGTGAYRIAPADAASRISYADLAIAVLDEIERPKHHRTHVGVETA